MAKNVSLLGLQNLQQARNIAERKRADEALRESEECYCRLVESSKVWIFWVRKEMKGEGNLKLKALLSISEIDLKKDLKQILNEILTIVGGEMGAHSGSVMLVTEETGELEMVATYGLPDDYIERVHSKRVPITTSPCGVVLETGRYYLVPNIFEEPRDKLWMDLARELGFSSQILMPMKRKGEVIGLLNIYMANPHEFTESEIAFLTIAANHTAAVIENAKLYARMLNKKMELEHEITECNRMEEALRESEEFSSCLLKNSPYPIIVHNSDTSIRYVNPALEKLTGFSSAELIGRKAPYPWWTEETLEKTGREFEEALHKGALKVEMLFQRKDRERFWVELTSVPVKKDGELKYYLANWVDITELKKAEEALQKAHDELERRVKERTVELLQANEQLKQEIGERKQAEKKVKTLELPALHRLFKQGNSYLIIEEKPDTSFKLFGKLLEYEFKGLLLSRTHPTHIHEKCNIKDVPTIWLTNVKGVNHIVPTNITQLSIAVKDFVKRGVEGVIMLEGLEYLIDQNGFEVTLRFVESLTDIFTMSKCRLIMPFDARTLVEVELHRLEREVNVMNAKEVQVIILD